MKNKFQVDVFYEFSYNESAGAHLRAILMLLYAGSLFPDHHIVAPLECDENEASWMFRNMSFRFV